LFFKRTVKIIKERRRAGAMAQTMSSNPSAPENKKKTKKEEEIL
jgi:hypothetical protein